MTKLEEIRKRLEAATPGPWGFVPGQKSMQVYSEADGDDHIYSGEWVAEVGLLADQQLIAHAPSDLALLLAIVERQAKVIALAVDAYRTNEEGVRYISDQARECIAEVEKLVGGKDGI